MTNLEALRARVGYPVSDNSLEYCLTKRSLDKDDVWLSGSNTSSFDLAYADALCVILTSPSNVSEGGFTISQGDRKYLAETANKIYQNYDQANFIPTSKPTATFKQPW